MKLLSLLEIAQMLNITVSTASHYKNRHSQFIRSEGVGRQKRYKPQALDVMRFISEKTNSNTTTQEMNSWLSSEFDSLIS